MLTTVSEEFKNLRHKQKLSKTTESVLFSSFTYIHIIINAKLPRNISRVTNYVYLVPSDRKTKTPSTLFFCLVSCSCLRFISRTKSLTKRSCYCYACWFVWLSDSQCCCFLLWLQWKLCKIMARQPPCCRGPNDR